MTLETHRLETLEGVQAFLAGNEGVDMAPLDRESSYRFVRETLVRYRYRSLVRGEKGVIRRYLANATGKSLTASAGVWRRPGLVHIGFTSPETAWRC